MNIKLNFLVIIARYLLFKYFWIVMSGDELRKKILGDAWG
jgi:hypothetical protein